MTMRFIKCLVLVALVHVFAAAMVFGAYHFTKAGNEAFVENTESDPGSGTVLANTTQTDQVSGKKHEVKSGESYWSIAKQYKLDEKRAQCADPKPVQIARQPDQLFEACASVEIIPLDGIG